MLSVCRVCLSQINPKCAFYKVNTVEEVTGFMPVRDKLTLVVPEMALDLVIDPVLCANCRNSLQIAYNFKQQCLKTDMELHNSLQYVELENGCIRIEDVIRLIRNPEEKAKKLDLKQQKISEELNADSYSELRTILETHQPNNETSKKSSSQQQQRVIININNKPMKKEIKSEFKATTTANKTLTLINNDAISMHTYSKQLRAKEQVIHKIEIDDDEETEDGGGGGKEEEDEEGTDTLLIKLKTEPVVLESEEKVFPSEEELSENFIEILDVSTNPNPNDVNEMKSYMCKICTAKIPANPPQLKAHLLMHKAVSTHICYVCNRRFKGLNYLRRHENTHLEKERYGKTLKCFKCKKVFNNIASFKKHKHEETGEVIKQPIRNRNTLPKEAKQIMKKWLYTHKDNPYPTDVEKQELVEKTNLKYIQVENWFVNARRRILNKNRIMDFDDSS